MSILDASSKWSDFFKSIDSGDDDKKKDDENIIGGGKSGDSQKVGQSATPDSDPSTYPGTYPGVINQPFKLPEYDLPKDVGVPDIYDGNDSASTDYTASQTKGGGILGGILGLISDERAKKNIQRAGSINDQFAAMTPVTYDYKQGYGGGSHVGVIAQDIERTPVGKNMVGSKDVDGKRVKAIDSKEAVSTLLANAAEQAKRIKELENRTGGGAANEGDRQSLIATGENHPLTGRPILRTPSGDVATEMGITVTDPRLNGGNPTNIPSIWGMKSLGDRDAVTAALKSGQKFAEYKSIPAAVKASNEHSAELGRYLDESGKVRRDDISNGPIIQAPDGVSIKTNGSTVLVDDNVPGTQFFIPKKKYQGGQTLSPSDAKNLFNVIGAENKRMDRQPAMQLFEQNPPYVPQDAARYGREMMQYAQALKKRPGGIM